MLRVRDVELRHYFSQLRKIALLTAEQELALAERVQNGDFAARDELVRGNLRLVVAISRRFVRTGVCYQDIIAEGNLGLVHAADLYQPDRATRFATYAKWWILHSIQQFICATAHPMRLPHYMIRRMARMHEQSRVFQDSRGRAPSETELHGECNSTSSQLAPVQHASRAFRITVMDYHNDSDRRTMEEAIPDRQTPQPGHELETRETLAKLRVLLGTLDDREATVLRLRHGIGSAEPLPMEKIAGILGVTRQRVRQIELEGLRKLESLHASGEGVDARRNELGAVMQKAMSA